MAGRKRHSAEDIVRKLRRADELAAEGKTGEEIAAELGVSAATLYNWRRAYGGMDTDAAKELKELREQNARLKRLLADAELEKDALREVAEDTAIDVIKCRVWCSRRAGPGRPRGPDTFLAADDLGHRKAFAGTAIGAGTSAWISPRTGRFSAQRQFDYRRLIGVFDSYVGGGRVDLSVRGRGSGAHGPW